MGHHTELLQMQKVFLRGWWTPYVLTPLIRDRNLLSRIADHPSQRDKRFVFEDPKPSSSNLGATAISAQEWLDALDRAREMASQNNSGDEGFRDLSSGMSSHSNTLDRTSEIQDGALHGRATLIKHQATDSESVKGRKRFSRRHSKNGLAAVF